MEKQREKLPFLTRDVSDQTNIFEQIYLELIICAYYKIPCIMGIFNKFNKVTSQSYKPKLRIKVFIRL